MNEQLTDLVEHFRKANPIDVVEGKDVLDRYFEQIGWSALKGEWEQMSGDQQDWFVEKLIEKVFWNNV